jgi:hypothetical protein
MDVMKGQKGKYFKKFRELMITGFLAIQDDAAKILILIEMMISVNKNLPCFSGSDSSTIVDEVTSRIFPEIKGKKQKTKMNRLECSLYIDQ